MISELLRNADKVIKTGTLDDAMKFINKVFEIDQKNIYAKAYKERILSLMEAQGVSREEAERISAQAKFNEGVTPPSHPKPEQKAENETPKKVEIPVQQLSQPIATTTPQVKPATSPLVATVSSPQKKIQSAPPMPGKHVTQIRRTVAAKEAYKTLLMEIW